MTRLLLALALAACSITPKPVAAPPVAASVVSGELAARRAQLISWLHDYRVAGVFPTDANGRPLSVFMDDHGVRCPMAEMIHQSGRDDLVLAVHHENNAVRLANVHGGPLFDWMLASGLTQEEVVMVQGAMTYQEQLQFRGEVIQMPVQTADTIVRSNLAIAEAALQSATPESLVTATRRLPNVAVAKLAATPITTVDVLASR